jgi:hypothetical protein
MMANAYNGEQTLVHVQFIIPFSLLPSTAKPPTLFGHQSTLDFTFQLWKCAS